MWALGQASEWPLPWPVHARQATLLQKPAVSLLTPKGLPVPPGPELAFAPLGAETHWRKEKGPASWGAVGRRGAGHRRAGWGGGGRGALAPLVMRKFPAAGFLSPAESETGSPSVSRWQQPGPQTGDRQQWPSLQGPQLPSVACGPGGGRRSGPGKPTLAMVPCWNHGNITRSKAEELLSRTGKDGSFLVRASESISRAYALCVL